MHSYLHRIQNMEKKNLKTKSQIFTSLSLKKILRSSSINVYKIELYAAPKVCWHFSSLCIRGFCIYCHERNSFECWIPYISLFMYEK